MMGRVALVLCAILAAAGMATEAQAVCIYRGELYAKSTITGEFRESALVVRGVVLSNHDIEVPDGEDSWTGVVTKVRVEQVYKGRPGPVVTLYSRRSSGAFYVDAGERYLLFLAPIGRGEWAADYPGAMVANYQCGQSVPWAELSARKRRALAYETRRLRQK